MLTSYSHFGSILCSVQRPDPKLLLKQMYCKGSLPDDRPAICYHAEAPSGLMAIGRSQMSRPWPVWDRILLSPKAKENLLMHCFLGWFNVVGPAAMEVEEKLADMPLLRACLLAEIAERHSGLCPEVLLKTCFFGWRDVVYWHDVLEEEEALAEMVRVGEVKLVDLVAEGDESEKVEEEVLGEEDDFVLVEEVEMEAVEGWVEEWPDTDDGF